MSTGRYALLCLIAVLLMADLVAIVYVWRNRK